MIDFINFTLIAFKYIKNTNFAIDFKPSTCHLIDYISVVACSSPTTPQDRDTTRELQALSAVRRCGRVPLSCRCGRHGYSM